MTVTKKRPSPKITPKISVKLVRRYKASSVVVHKDKTGLLNAYIIDSDYISSMKPGAEFTVPKEAIDKATPFGVDWEVIYPDGIMISAKEMQNIMYSNGIYTLDDVIKNTPMLIQSINNILKLNSANIISDIRKAIGG